MSALKEFTVFSMIYLYIYTQRDMCNSIIILPRFQVRESF